MPSNLSVLDKQALATALDCEGYIGIIKPAIAFHRLTPGYHIRVSVAMTTPQYIKLLHDTYGGYIRVRGGRHATWKEQYDWGVSSKKAVALLQDLLPYFRIKKPQADICLAFHAARLACGHRWNRNEGLPSDVITRYQDYYLQMRRLNARGKNQTGVDCLSTSD